MGIQLYICSNKNFDNAEHIRMDYRTRKEKEAFLRSIGMTHARGGKPLEQCKDNQIHAIFRDKVAVININHSKKETNQQNFFDLNGNIRADLHTV